MSDGGNTSIQNSMFKGQPEKSLIDKFLGRQDIEKIRGLIRKENLTRSELVELENAVIGGEIKLVNFNDWDRYVMSKYYVWIGAYIHNTMLLYDYVDKAEKLFSEGHVNERTIKMLKNCQRYMEHNVKYHLNVYLNLIRSSLSINATGFRELLTSRSEYTYDTKGMGSGVDQPSIKPFGRR